MRGFAILVGKIARESLQFLPEKLILA